MMTTEGVTKKLPAISPVRTQQIVDNLKKLSAGWGGSEEYKKPASRAVKRLEKLLSRLEFGFMPWPNITAVANGGLVLTWISMNRDIMVTIDPEGDVQFITSLKKVDLQTFEITDRLDSEGAIVDLQAVDHLMAWYAQDTASHC